MELNEDGRIMDFMDFRFSDSSESNMNLSTEHSHRSFQVLKACTISSGIEQLSY